MASGLKQVRMNNAVRGAVDAALGSLRLFAPDAAIRLDAAEAVFHSHDPAALPALERALAHESDAGVKRRMEQARAAALLFADDSKRRRPAGRDRRAARARRHRQPQPARVAVRPAARGDARPPRPRSTAIDRNLQLWSIAQSVYYGLSAGLGAAAGRGRPRDHLRRHGRDQHGAWRDGDDRRLRDLHGAAVHSRAARRAVRRQPADRCAARVHRRRADRHRHRAHADPLAVRPTAGDAAGDLGSVAGPAAGGALDLRRQQPRRRARRTG